MITRAGFLAAATAAALPARALAQNQAGDVRLLNVALQIEHLQTALYRGALRSVPRLSAPARALARTHGRHDREHARALTDLISRLGGEAAPAPRARLDAALRSEGEFLRAAQLLEDTAVAVYGGAGPDLRNPSVLALVGAIAQVEARHAATVRALRDVDPAPRPFEPVLDAASARERLRPLLS